MEIGAIHYKVTQMTQNKLRASRLTETIIRSDPCLQTMLSRGLLNLSKTAEWISTTLEGENLNVSPQAVKTALSRLKQKLENEAMPLHKPAELLSKSSLELRTDVAVITYPVTALGYIADKVRRLAGSSRILLLFQGVTTITLTIGEEHADEILESIPVEPVNTSRERTLLIIISPHEIIYTHGFISYIATILANAGINIEQIMSVHTDTVIIVSPEDAEKAYKIISASKKLYKNIYRG